MEGTKEWVRTNGIVAPVVEEYEAEHSAEKKTLEQGQMGTMGMLSRK